MNPIIPGNVLGDYHEFIKTLPDRVPIEEVKFTLVVPIEGDTGAMMSPNEVWFAVIVSHRLFYCPLIRGAEMMEIRSVDSAGRNARVKHFTWNGDELIFTTEEWIVNKWVTEAVHSFNPHSREQQEIGHCEYIDGLETINTCVLVQNEEGDVCLVRGAMDRIPANIAVFETRGKEWAANIDNTLVLSSGSRIRSVSDPEALCWSPDGTRIAYGTERVIGVVDVSTHRTVCLATTSAPEQIQWTPFGIVFTFVSGIMRVYTEDMVPRDAYRLPWGDFVLSTHYAAIAEERMFHICSSYEGSNRIRRLTARVGLMAVRRNMVRRETRCGVSFEIEEDAKPALRLISRFLY